MMCAPRSISVHLVHTGWGLSSMDLPPEPVPQPGAVPGIILRRHGGDEAVRPGSPIGVGARHSVAAGGGGGGGWRSGGGEGDGGGADDGELRRRFPSRGRCPVAYCAATAATKLYGPVPQSGSVPVTVSPPRWGRVARAAAARAMATVATATAARAGPATPTAIPPPARSHLMNYPRARFLAAVSVCCISAPRSSGTKREGI